MAALGALLEFVEPMQPVVCRLMTDGPSNPCKIAVRALDGVEGISCCCQHCNASCRKQGREQIPRYLQRKPLGYRDKGEACKEGVACPRKLALLACGFQKG